MNQWYSDTVPLKWSVIQWYSAIHYPELVIQWFSAIHYPEQWSSKPVHWSSLWSSSDHSSSSRSSRDHSSSLWSFQLWSSRDHSSSLWSFQQQTESLCDQSSRSREYPCYHIVAFKPKERGGYFSLTLLFCFHYFI